MNKGRSIFTKYFAICSAVILISFCCLGTVLLLVSTRYFLDSKKSLMLKDAKALRDYTKEKMLEEPDGYLNDVRSELKYYSIASNADYLICSSDGYVIANTGGNRGNTDDNSENTDDSGENTEDGKKKSDESEVWIDKDLLSKFDSEGRYQYSKLGSDPEEVCHIMGVSFQANGPLYYVLAYSPKSTQDSYTQNIMEIFMVSAIGVLVVVMFLVYFATLKLTSPITEVAEIAKKLGSGDFSVTLPEYNTKEFDQLSTAFNEMAANLKSYDTMRNSFLANVSHELRTPMTSIGGFVDGMLDGTIPKSQQTYYLRIISSEVARLTRLVKSMLNLAKIEAGELEPNKTNFAVTEPILDTLLTFEPRIEEKNIEIRGLDVQRINLYADLDLIHQVMYNLIENAIKFVDKGGYIEFSFAEDTEGTSVTIRNSGEGLAEDELPLVFDRFYKTDKSRGIHAQGLGLGLNIARSIIEIHGGQIMVKSRKGEFTEFTFTIPKADAKLTKADAKATKAEAKATKAESKAAKAEAKATKAESKAAKAEAKATKAESKAAKSKNSKKSE
ncbi:MAG: HAMP domain-containing histidine kinase [Ruminococcus sp.]|nr:HAMP domain-containing histidine kinase [Ruminococcus sp.]MBQ1432698.1 HAMP domain-containing histidine kinase [Ruminococcus sp.]